MLLGSLTASKRDSTKRIFNIQRL